MDRKLVVLLAVLCMQPLLVLAKTSTWNGNQWSTIDITDPKAVNHNFILLADYTLTASISVKTLSVSPNATLLFSDATVQISDNLTVQGTISGSGAIVSAGNIAAIDVTGTINAENINVDAGAVSVRNGGTVHFSTATITDVSIASQGAATAAGAVVCQNLTIEAGNSAVALTTMAPFVVQNNASIASAVELNDTLNIQLLCYLQAEASVVGSGLLYINEGASLVNYSQQVSVPQSYTRTWSDNTYAFICMPFPEQTNTFGTRVYYFAEQNTPSGSGWVRTPLGSALLRGPGYIAFAAGKQEFTGFTNLDPVTIPVTRTETAADPKDVGANLIGNPYTCPLSFSAFSAANATLVEPAIYLWADGGKDTAGTRAGDYIVKNDLGASGAIGSIDISGDNIASMQAFFVRAIADGTLTIDQSMILPDADNTNALKADRRQYNKLRISLSNQYVYNDVLIGFVTNEPIEKYQAEKKQGNNNFAFYITSPQGKKLGITAIEYQELDSVVVPLGITVNEPAEFTIAIEEENLPFAADSIILVNTSTGERIDLFSGSATISCKTDQETSWQLVIYAPETETADSAKNKVDKKRGKKLSKQPKLVHTERIDLWGRKKYRNKDGQKHSIEINRYSDGTTEQYIRVGKRQK